MFSAIIRFLFRRFRSRVFISYRRTDGNEKSTEIYNNLKSYYQVFLDNEDLEGGDKFDRRILDVIKYSRVLLVIIGTKWLDILHQRQLPALEGSVVMESVPEDYVVKEIECALHNQLKIIPILIDGAQMPDKSQLPPSIQGLATNQAFVYPSNQKNRVRKRLLRDEVGRFYSLRKHFPLALRRFILLFLPCAIVCTAFFSWLSVYIQPPIIPLSSAHINGWFVVQVHTNGVFRSLYVVDPRTGNLAPLWPNAQELNAPNLTAHYALFTDPTYSADSRKIAFVGHRDDGTKIALVASIAIGNNGLPFIDGAPVQVAPICAQCDNIISLSKSGQWLIYGGGDGLYAVSTVTLERHQITTSAKDVWPACSPDGNWLAFQGHTNSLIAVPAIDCIPNKALPTRTKYLNGATYSWSPQWSPDSQKIAFVSNYTNVWLLYEVSLKDMGTSNNPTEIDHYNRIWASNCSFAAWAETDPDKRALLVMSCTNSVTDGYLLIEPDGFRPSWQAKLNANGDSWEKSVWISN